VHIDLATMLNKKIYIFKNLCEVFYFVKDATFYHNLKIVYFNGQIMKKLKNFCDNFLFQ